MRLRSWWQRLVLLLLVLVGAFLWVLWTDANISMDHAQRVRISEALAQLAVVRAGISEEAANTGRVPPNMSPFIPQPHYSIRGNDSEPDMPETIAFTIRANGQRLDAKFDDENQGGLSGKTLSMALTGPGRMQDWKCFSEDIDPRWLPSVCRGR